MEGQNLSNNISQFTGQTSNMNKQSFYQSERRKVFENLYRLDKKISELSENLKELKLHYAMLSEENSTLLNQSKEEGLNDDVRKISVSLFKKQLKKYNKLKFYNREKEYKFCQKYKTQLLLFHCSLT